MQISKAHEELKFSYSTSTITNVKVKNQTIGVEELVYILQEQKAISAFVKMQEIIKTALNSNKRLSDVKGDYQPYKENLSWLMIGGTQDYGHNDKDINLNGCLQIDIDKLKSIKEAKQTAAKLATHPNILLSFVSPSNFGVKAIYLTNNTNKSLHEYVSKKVNLELSYFLELNNGQWDINNIKSSTSSNSPFDIRVASQPCFLPNWENKPGMVYYNENAVVNILNATEMQQEYAKLQKEEHDLIAKRAANIVTVLDEKQLNKALKFALATAKNAHGRVGNDFVTTYAGKALTLGIPANTAWEYLLANADRSGIKNSETKQFFRIYNTYSSTFGSDIWQLNEGPKFNFVEQVKETTNSHKLNKKQYVTDLNLTFKSEKTYQIISPTGSGKTVFVSKYAGKKVIIVPSQTQVLQLATETGATMFFEEVKQISDFIVTTPQSFTNLTNSLNYSADCSEYTLFIDEAHNFTTSTNQSFCGFDYNAILDNVAQYKQTFLLTGTTIHNSHPFFKNVETINITKETTCKKEVCIVNYTENRIATICELVNKNAKQGIFTHTLLNNTKEDGVLGKLEAALSTLNISYAHVNSKTKDTDTHKDITYNAKIEDNLQLLISTSVLKEGVNITEHAENVSLLVVGNFHPIEILQTVARYRKAKTVTILVLKKQADIEKEQDNLDFCKLVIENKMIELSKLQAASLNAQIDLAGDYISLNAANVLSQNVKLRYNTLMQVTPDYLAISNAVFVKETTFLNANISFYKEYFENYGWQILDDVCLNTELNVEQTMEIETKMQEAEATKQTKLENSLTKLKNSSWEQITDSVEKKTLKDETEIQLYTKVLSLKQFFNKVTNAVNFLTEKIGLKNAAWEDFKLYKKVMQARTWNKLKNAATGVSKLIRMVEKSFKIGETYELNTILNMMQQIYEKSKMGSINEANAKKVFLSFFGVEKGVNKVNGKNITCYTIINNNSYGLKINTTQEKMEDVVDMFAF